MVFDFSWLTNFISSMLDRLIGLLHNLVIDFCNAVIVALSSAVLAVVNFLPSGSASSAGSVSSLFLGTINWFLPIPGIIASLTMYFSGWLLYMGIAPLTRWFKVTK